MSICLRRRDFIAGLGGAAAWPLAARAQQGGRVRRIGWLNNSGDENDPLAKSNVAAFTHALADLGWTDGRNVRIDLRWASSDIKGLGQAPGQGLKAQAVLFCLDSSPWRRGGWNSARGPLRPARPRQGPQSVDLNRSPTRGPCCLAARGESPAHLVACNSRAGSCRSRVIAAAGYSVPFLARSSQVMT